MEQLSEKFFYTVEVPCPECGGDMKAWKEKEGVEPRCAPVCASCGHKSLMKKEAITTKRLFEDSLKQKGFNYLRYGSLLTDKSLWDCTLNGYKELDADTTNAKRIAIESCKQIMDGKEIHVVFSGTPGTGKSHLAMGMLQGILKKSNYEKKVLFVSYRELLEQLKFAMNDEAARKQITGSLMAELKLADVVVLDDLGAELGTIDAATKATTYNLDVLTSVLEARQSKATIFTTNLSGETIGNVYGDRILSRILMNSTGYTAELKFSSDKRMVGV